MYPDWILILNILIGLIGIYLGYRLVKNRISILMALIIDIPIFILGLIITHYVPM
jgi:xanthosine utilization system XapX-like protein